MTWRGAGGKVELARTTNHKQPFTKEELSPISRAQNQYPDDYGRLGIAIVRQREVLVLIRGAASDETQFHIRLNNASEV